MVLIITIKALLVTVPHWNEPKCPSLKDWLSKLS